MARVLSFGHHLSFFGASGRLCFVIMILPIYLNLIFLLQEVFEPI